MIKKTLLLSILIYFGLFQTNFAQNEPLWLRYPAISPNGEKIAFTYKGDIYLVDVRGGVARPLTISDSYEYAPVWSPDGKYIAFATDRYGNFDVFVMASTGGKAKRLTYYSGNEKPYSFTPDSKNILFTSVILDDYMFSQFPRSSFPELYQVNTEGGRVKQVLSITALHPYINKDNKFMLFNNKPGIENDWRKHHTSSVTRDIWMYNFADKKFKQLTTFNGEDRNPVLSSDEKTVYYLSEKYDSCFNIVSLELSNPETTKQITKHDKHPVRFLTIANNNTLCYSYDGEIYVKKENQETEKVKIIIQVDKNEKLFEYKKSSKGVSDISVSEDGKEVAFTYRGDIYVSSVKYETTRQITNTPEQERNVKFSKDGKSLVYAGERNGSWNIYQTKIIDKEENRSFVNCLNFKEEVVIASEKEEFQPAFSPDGKEVAYLEERTTLKVINLKSKKTRTILDGKYNYSYSDGDQWYDWSPDGKWFLVQYSPNHLFINEVALVDAEGKQKITNLTNSGYTDGTPKWMMDGEMFIWFSDREGYRSHGSWGSHLDVYAMFFTQEAYDKFTMSKEEYAYYKKEEKEDDEDKDKSDKKKDKDDFKPITINLTGIEDRQIRLTINSSRISDAILSNDGEKLFYLARFEKGFDLWVKEIRENKTKLVLKLNGYTGAMHLDKKGKNLYMYSNGSIIKVDTKNYSKKSVSFTAEKTIDFYAERAYMFEHVWRQMHKKFYVKNMHNVDWKFYKKEYEKFLPYIQNNYDFAEMLSEMLGELNASHTGSGYRHRDSKGDNTAKLGLFYDNNYSGDGLKIVEVMDKSPVIKSDTKIEAGVIIEKIDGNELKANEDYHQYLNHKRGKNTILTLYNPNSKERWKEVVKPISSGQENQLLYERWVKIRKQKTEELSQGRIGYVHVRGMNSSSFRDVFSEILGRNFKKEAIIVDTRYNGGGWLHDDLVTLLSGKKYVDYIPRGQHFGYDPMAKWIKKSIVLINESNYSDAHAFPYAYKTLGIGKLVGMPIPGTMTAVWWETLMDRDLYFGIPQVGSVDKNGNYLENQQLEPDIKIQNTFESMLKGEDLQLKKAIDVLINDLD